MDDDQIEHGHVRDSVTVTATPADGVSMLPLSSNDRLRIVTVAAAADACRCNSSCVVPVAFFQVVPPSSETWTPATMPPPESTALPVTVIGEPAREARRCSPGEVIVDVGAAVSVEADAAHQPGLKRSWLRPHVGEQIDRRLLHRGRRLARCPRSWLASRPHDHCTVPAPKTSAPLGVRGTASACASTVPAPNVEP